MNENAVAYSRESKQTLGYGYPRILIRCRARKAKEPDAAKMLSHGEGIIKRVQVHSCAAMLSSTR